MVEFLKNNKNYFNFFKKKLSILKKTLFSLQILICITATPGKYEIIK